MRPKVKICGITNADDARLSADLGANALGFIFTEVSSRYLTIDQAVEFMFDLPPFVERVGVFQDQSVHEIIEHLSILPLSVIQLHGGEDNEYISELQAYTSLPVIKAYRRPTIEQIQSLDLDKVYLQGLLIDGLAEGVSYADIAEVIDLPIILAGGIGPDNVQEVWSENSEIAYALDLCSRVESQPRQKDKAKLEQFFEAIREM